MLLDKLC